MAEGAAGSVTSGRISKMSMKKLSDVLNNAEEELSRLLEKQVNDDIDVQLHGEQVKRAYDEFVVLSRDYESRLTASPELRRASKKARLAYMTEVNIIIRSCNAIWRDYDGYDQDIDEFSDRASLASCYSNVNPQERVVTGGNLDGQADGATGHPQDTQIRSMPNLSTLNLGPSVPHEPPLVNPLQNGASANGVAASGITGPPPSRNLPADGVANDGNGSAARSMGTSELNRKYSFAEFSAHLGEMLGMVGDPDFSRRSIFPIPVPPTTVASSSSFEIDPELINPTLPAFPRVTFASSNGSSLEWMGTHGSIPGSQMDGNRPAVRPPAPFVPPANTAYPPAQATAMNVPFTNPTATGHGFVDNSVGWLKMQLEREPSDKDKYCGGQGFHFWAGHLQSRIKQVPSLTGMDKLRILKLHTSGKALAIIEPLIKAARFATAERQFQYAWGALHDRFGTQDFLAEEIEADI